MFFLTCCLLPLLFPATPALASTGAGAASLALTHHWWAWACVGLFVLFYIPVLFEEKFKIRKSKPLMLCAGLIWIVIALAAPHAGISPDAIHDGVMRGLEEYAELLLFLLASMIFINTMQERNVFACVRARLILAGLSLRQMFWVTGIIAFFMSGIADNLTTSLVMGAVVIAVGGSNKKFIAIACVNIVCAANAGGAFSPFGDITTLMAWQAGKAEFFEFFHLFVPSVVSYLVPALLMSPFVPTTEPEEIDEHPSLKHGAKIVVVLGLCSLGLAIWFEQGLHLPAFFGLMTGLSVLMLYGWHLQRKHDPSFDIFERVSHAEWDTLLFFFGIIFAVGGLDFLGYLQQASVILHTNIGVGPANIALGAISALVDNIPVMFAVLRMNPPMDHFQWLLITLATGIGGSLLSIGSAAGIALMGIARGRYTFMTHLKWSPAILLGYGAGIATHYLLNG